MNALNGLSGKISIMRVLVSSIVATVLLTWVTGNIICWCHGCQFVSIGVQEVALILGALACKAGQRFGESKSPTSTTNVIPFDKAQ